MSVAALNMDSSEGSYRFWRNPRVDYRTRGGTTSLVCHCSKILLRVLYSAPTPWWVGLGKWQPDIPIGTATHKANSEGLDLALPGH